VGFLSIADRLWNGAVIDDNPVFRPELPTSHHGGRLSNGTCNRLTNKTDGSARMNKGFLLSLPSINARHGVFPELNPSK